MTLPGAHSAGDSADGEDLPEWVSIFQRYWEYKKSHPSKTALEEQKREARRTMQRTILGPIQPLGEITNEVVNETSSTKSKHKTSKSLIVEGGKMIVVPAVNSTGTTPRPCNSRRVSTSSQCQQKNSIHSTAAPHPEIAGMLSFLKESNNNLFRRSYKEILEDLDLMKSRLENARATNDFDAIKLYDGICKKLVSELQGNSTT
jgi:hypothetical protein